MLQLRHVLKEKYKTMKTYYYEGTVTKRIKGLFTTDDHRDPYEILDDRAWKLDSFFNEAEFEGKITDIEINNIVEIERR